LSQECSGISGRSATISIEMLLTLHGVGGNKAGIPMSGPYDMSGRRGLMFEKSETSPSA
jgi:hypothetical protein